MKNNITKDFVDEKGENTELVLTSSDDRTINLKNNYKLQRPETNNKYMKKGAKAKSVFTSDIGVKSEGFAPIVTLSLIIVIGLVTIALIMWRL